MQCVTDVDVTCSGFLNLGMTFQTEIGIALNEHFSIDRSVRVVANGASFAEGFVLEDKWPSLLAMTLRAIFVKPCHRQSAGWFKNIRPVRVMTFHTVHAPFQHGMSLRQLKLGMGLQVALEASLGIFSWVDNKLASPTSGFRVFAAWTVAGFASGLALEVGVFNVDAGMRAGGENPCNVRMTIIASPVADVGGAGDFRGSNDCAGDA